MPEIRFLPENQTVAAGPGETLLEAAARAAIPLRNDCGGMGSCEQCRLIRIDPGGGEQEILACREPADRDQVLRVPESSLQHAPLRILTDGACARRESSSGEIPAEGEFGLALDIGTTTLALELVDLRNGRSLGVVGRENPQKRRFGDDIISRIQKVHDDPANTTRQQAVLLDAVNAMIDELFHENRSGIERVVRMTAAGNSVMELLFLGLDVSSLGWTPFEPVAKRFQPVRAAALGLRLPEDVEIHCMPLIGGFVGGDLTGGVLAVQLADREPPVLLLDIGTNGEMVLASRETNRATSRLSAAATAAGPAFEGARITQGMIAAPGAIESMTIDQTSGRLHIRTIGDRKPCGFCGSGLVDAVALMLEHGVLTESGKLRAVGSGPFAGRFRDVEKMPAVVFVSEDESGRDKEAVYLNQRDIRQVQLAVGAIRTGVRLLLRESGLVPADLKAVFLAGGFGNYIRMESARRIGLLPPDVLPERIIASGNSSLAGAKELLCVKGLETTARVLSEQTTHLELASCRDFTAVFAESMLFPDGTAVT